MRKESMKFSRFAATCALALLRCEWRDDEASYISAVEFGYLGLLNMRSEPFQNKQAFASFFCCLMLVHWWLGLKWRFNAQFPVLAKKNM
jgi:hypothetical protein